MLHAEVRGAAGPRSALKTKRPSCNAPFALPRLHGRVRPGHPAGGAPSGESIGRPLGGGGFRLVLAPLARALPAGAFVRSDLLAFAARFRQADRDRLFPALHGLAAATALEGAPLALVHRPLHVLGSALRRLACHLTISTNVKGLSQRKASGKGSYRRDLPVCASECSERRRDPELSTVSIMARRRT